MENKNVEGDISFIQIGEGNEKEPFEAVKRYLLEKEKLAFDLLNRKDKIIKNPINIRTFSFFEKIFKRKEYKEYQKKLEKEEKQRKEELNEIENKIVEEGIIFDSFGMIEDRMKMLKKATTYSEIGIVNTEKAIEILINNKVKFKFKSFEEAFKLAPEFLGNNIEFMKKAIMKDKKFIQYDRTNNQELYKKVIVTRIKELKEKRKESKLCDKEELELSELDYLRQELNSPKEVKEEKYKIPYKYLFEEIRRYIVSNDINELKYRNIDGIFDKQFGRELEKIYKSGNIVGIYGLKSNSDLEEVLAQGISTLTTEKDRDLFKTIVCGKNLKFTQLLDYEKSNDGIKNESVIIVVIPKNAFDKYNPNPIWGSNTPTGIDNYILPKYIYGYYNNSDGKDRKFKINNRKKKNYKYFKYDVGSCKKEEVMQNFEFIIQ